MTERRPGAPARSASAGLAKLPRLSGPDFAPQSTVAGRAWVTRLPSLVRQVADAWRLVVDTDDVCHGYNAVVLLAEQSGRPVSLKLVWPPHRARSESAALEAWHGGGVVELIRVDHRRGALLLERLDGSSPLSRLPLAQAAETAGRLIATLAIVPPPGDRAVPASPAPPAFPTTQDEARRLAVSLRRRQRALGQPVPPDWVKLATTLARNLSASPAAFLVHADLHYDNVLASYRRGNPWIAVDPKAAVGDPERSVPELLWTRADELDDATAITLLLEQIVSSGRLEPDRATAWAFVRTIDYWLWGLRHGLTEDPVRCERIARALLARSGRR